MGEGATVLVVDDDRDIRETVSLVLEMRGYHVIPAVDGVDALDRLKHGAAPDMVLLDLMMPRMNGADLVKEMRSDPSLSRIPVVVLSGDSAARRTAGTLRTEGCLLKPVDMDALLAEVERFTSRAAH